MYLHCILIPILLGGGRELLGRNRMVVGCTTACAISAYFNDKEFKTDVKYP